MAKNKIQLRRDLAQRWIDVNPTLAMGEPGFETDTNKLKIGDGIHDWLSLDYISAAVFKDAEKTDIITCTTNGQVSFLLNSTPINPNSVRMIPEGGIELINTIDFNVSGQTVSYIAPDPIFYIGDVIVFKYLGHA